MLARHIYFRHNATSGCVGNNVVEPSDIENMDVCFGILFLSVLCAEMVLLPVLGGRHIYARYNATSSDIVDNTIEQLDLESLGIAVRILFLAVLCAEIVLLPVSAAALSISGITRLPDVLATKLLNRATSKIWT